MGKKGRNTEANPILYKFYFLSTGEFSFPYINILVFVFKFNYKHHILYLILELFELSISQDLNFHIRYKFGFTPVLFQIDFLWSTNS